MTSSDTIKTNTNTYSKKHWITVRLGMRAWGYSWRNITDETWLDTQDPSIPWRVGNDSRHTDLRVCLKNHWIHDFRSCKSPPCPIIQVGDVFKFWKRKSSTFGDSLRSFQGTGNDIEIVALSIFPPTLVEEEPSTDGAPVVWPTKFLNTQFNCNLTKGLTNHIWRL